MQAPTVRPAAAIVAAMLAGGAPPAEVPGPNRKARRAEAAELRRCRWVRGLPSAVLRKIER